MKAHLEIEMPTSCFDCPVSHPAFGNLGAAILGCPLIGKTLSAPFCEEKRMDNCPLVPVQPHGRLIDEEVLIETIRKEVSYQSPLSVDALNVFAMVPTVIPADKEETCTKN